jgi:hypothetical protein
MKISNLSKRVLGSLAVAGLLAGCSSGGSQSGLTPSAMTPAQSRTHSNVKNHGPLNLSVAAVMLKGNMKPHAVHGIPQFSSPKLNAQQRAVLNNKMNPNIAIGPLLYISDAGTNTVYIYRYKFNFVVGFVNSITTGLNEPQGMCEGKSKAPGTVGKSIVWITNTLSQQIYGYTAPGGIPNTSPTYVVNVLDPDPGYFPVGCSLDPVTGNLAVTDITDALGGVGNVAIFSPATQATSNAPPDHTYFAPNIYRYYFTGYDGSGNLFVDGFDNALVNFVYDELPGGVGPGNQVTLLDSSCTVPVAYSFPGQVEYDPETKWMAVGDQIGLPPSLNREFNSSFCQRRNSVFRVISPPALTPNTDVVQSWIDVKTDRLFGPDAANGYVSLYQYSNGGTGGFPVQIGSGFTLPIGTALMR